MAQKFLYQDTRLLSGPNNSEQTISLKPMAEVGPEAWQAFLARANNPSLFHDLDFLDYHPQTRFNTHHLVFMRGRALLGLLPGALTDDQDLGVVYKSPYGATIGGMVLGPGPIGQEVAAMAQALVAYAQVQGWGAIEFILPPPEFARMPDHSQEFALMACGFRPTGSWLQHVIPLPASAEQVIPGLPDRRRRTAVRAARKKGVSVRIGTTGDLAAYHHLLSANRNRYGKQPVHTLGELQRLYELVPDRLALFLCEHQGELIGGTLCFEHHQKLAHSFAPCYGRSHKNLNATLAVTVAAMEHFAARGFGLLDLGGSTFDDYSFNPGVTAFKESLGGLALTRTVWRWKA